MKDRLVAVFVGHPDSGKTTAARYGARFHKMNYYCPSDFIYDEAAAQGRSLADRTATRAFLRELEAERGTGILVDPILRTYKDTIVDGLRRMHDLRLLRTARDTDVRVVAVRALLENRLARYKEQGGTLDTSAYLDAAEAEARSDDPLEPSVDELLEQADLTIYNNGTEHELFRSVDQALYTLRHEP